MIGTVCASNCRPGLACDPDDVDASAELTCATAETISLHATTEAFARPHNIRTLYPKARTVHLRLWQNVLACLPIRFPQ